MGAEERWLFRPHGFSPPRGIWREALGDFLKRLCGFLDPFAQRKPSASLNSTSCRGLVIEMASARRCDSEGSLAKYRGLSDSVKSKEKLAFVEQKVLYFQRKGSANGK